MRSTNKETISRTLICSLLIANLVIANLPIAHANEEKTNSTNERAVEIIQIFGSTNALDTAPGSGHAISEEQLEDFEFDDIHRVLQSVPGVYIREEDGYGLRPNIGLRGATSERSSKIALMEDGVLLSPAPYSAFQECLV
jgi:Fe(3+) dicitrate transport protein